MNRQTMNALNTVKDSEDVLSRVLPSEDLAALQKINHEVHHPLVRSQLLHDIRLLADSDEAAMGNRFFPKPAGFSDGEWIELKNRLMVLVNLLKASVRKVRSRVYGGNQFRLIVANPFEDDIRRFLGGNHGLDMREWFTNRVTFSSAPCMVFGTRTRSGRAKLVRWIPDPCFTYLASDPHDRREYVAMAEISPDLRHVTFVTRHAEGVIYTGSDVVRLDKNSPTPPAGQSFVKITDRGFFPGVVAHGETKPSRSPYSEPPFKDAVKFTTSATDILFNGRLLQKMQTKGLLWIAGQVALNTQDIAEMMRTGVLFTEADGKVGFLSPQSNITETLKMLDQIIEVYSVTHAIPVDDLNPTSSKGTSAEEANRRAEPHLSLTREFSQMAVVDETELVVRATAELAWMQPGAGPIDLDEIRDQVETEISLVPPVKPVASLEDAQISTMGLDRGIFSDEDAAVQWHENLSERKKAVVLANMQKKQAEAAMKETQHAGTDEPALQPGQ